MLSLNFIFRLLNSSLNKHDRQMTREEIGEPLTSIKFYNPRKICFLCSTLRKLNSQTEKEQSNNLKAT